jgi:hypothetical protein
MSDRKVQIVSDQVDELQKVFAQARGLGLDMGEVEAIVSKASLNIKRGAQRRIRGLAHAKAYPRAIGYDMRKTLNKVISDVGPDKEKRQGALGNILEYGSVNNPPHPHMHPAVKQELPRFEKAMEDLSIRKLGIEP